MSEIECECVCSVFSYSLWAKLEKIDRAHPINVGSTHIKSVTYDIPSSYRHFSHTWLTLFYFVILWDHSHYHVASLSRRHFVCLPFALLALSLDPYFGSICFLYLLYLILFAIIWPTFCCVAHCPIVHPWDVLRLP